MFSPGVAQAVGHGIDGRKVMGPKIYDLPHQKVMLSDGHYRDFVTGGPLSKQQQEELFIVYGILAGDPPLTPSLASDEAHAEIEGRS